MVDTELGDRINAARDVDLLLTMSDGERLRVEPEARALVQEGVVIYLVWPTDANLLHARRVKMLSAPHVDSVEEVPGEAPEAA